MTQNFVQYSPDVEQPEPDFEQTLQQVLDDMKRDICAARSKPRESGLWCATPMPRGTVSRGENLKFLVECRVRTRKASTPNRGRYEAMVRFSNGTSHVGGDRFLGPINGIGLKIFGIEGTTLLEDEPDSHTFDYALINHPVFFVNTLAHYVFIQSVFANIGLAPQSNLTPEDRQAGVPPGSVQLRVGKGNAASRAMGLGGTRRIPAARANQARESPSFDVLDYGCGAAWRLRRKGSCGPNSIIRGPR